MGHGRGYKLPWSLLDEKQSGELASLELPDHSLVFVRRMPWLWAARNHGHESPCETCAVGRCSTQCSHAGIVNGELVYVWSKVKKNRTDARTALVTHRWYGPAIVVGKDKNDVLVSYRGRVTKVAPECLRKASIADQMSWDITTKEKTLFENALDEENFFLWEENLLDVSVEFLGTEMPHTAVEPSNLPRDQSIVNDDDDSPISEP